MKINLLSQLISCGIQLKEFAENNDIEFIERHKPHLKTYHLKKERLHAIVEMPFINGRSIGIWRNSERTYARAYYHSDHDATDFIEFLIKFFKLKE